jgi:pterin-4a-carbinolamine dehydratase
MSRTNPFAEAAALLAPPAPATTLTPWQRKLLARAFADYQATNADRFARKIKTYLGKPLPPHKPPLSAEEAAAIGARFLAKAETADDRAAAALLFALPFGLPDSMTDRQVDALLAALVPGADLSNLPAEHHAIRELRRIMDQIRGRRELAHNHDILAWIGAHQGWNLEPLGAGFGLRRRFRFQSFARASAFFGAVAKLAERELHHPTIHLVPGKRAEVTVLWTTHEPKGVTSRDMELAEKTAHLFEVMEAPGRGGQRERPDDLLRLPGASLRLGPPGGAGHKPLPAADEDLARFVLAAARAVPASGRFGDKVFISEVIRELAAEGYRVADVKRRLAAARGLIPLSRADLVGAMDPELVRASETPYLGATFHFVRLEQGDGRELARSPDLSRAVDVSIVRSALRHLASNEPEGAVLSVPELRDRAGLDKERFDAAVLALEQADELVLHHHDFPASLSESDRAELVHDGRGTYDVGVAPRGRSASEMAPVDEAPRDMLGAVEALFLDNDYFPIRIGDRIDVTQDGVVLACIRMRGNEAVVEKVGDGAEAAAARARVANWLSGRIARAKGDGRHGAR